ncbi:oxygenase [Lithospermum erythrorhizon]|uniref:carotenoid 9,10-dioxygenase n=1 Tax=Lithospermum erythrorhizon TaxID=34254 RepID=A0AAV3Q4R1_LITER
MERWITKLCSHFEQGSKLRPIYTETFQDNDPPNTISNNNNYTLVVMAQQNQQMDLKRKLSTDVLGNDLQNKKAITTKSGTFHPNSGAFKLIDRFLKEEQSKGEKINDKYFHHHWWHREPLLLQYLNLIYKLITFTGGNPLEQLLEDIKALGLDILDVVDPPVNASTTIVTHALQLSKDKLCHPDDGSGVVKVDPKPKKGIISKIIDFSVKLVAKFHPDIPLHYLEGAFAPIREETGPTSNLILKGDIPESLNGMMVRNGPNPQFDPVALYSCMLHAIRFKDGKATYVSRYVQTSRFKQEKFFQEAEFLQYGDLDGQFGLLMSCVQLLRAKLGVFDVSYGWLNADTGVIFHDGMLMALQDFDKPYVVNVKENGDLETRGINDYRKGLTHSFIPHPKKDPHTGELFIAGVSYTPPYAIYSVITKEGVINNTVPLKMSGPSYMHDLGITHNYTIFMDLPYCYDPEHMVNHHDWLYRLVLEKKPRFGILPRYATNDDKMKWFEFDDCFFIFHIANSWEEDDDTIIFICCLMRPNIDPTKLLSSSTSNEVHSSLTSTRNLLINAAPKKTKTFFRPAHVYNGPKLRRNLTPRQVYNGPSLMGTGMSSMVGSYIDENSTTSQNRIANDEDENVEITLPTLYKFTFNMKTGESSHQQLLETFCDFPKINESYMGRKTRFVYTSEANEESKLISTVKTDLQWNTQIKLELGPNKYGSEVVFVSSHHSNTLDADHEDDGYLSTFVHDEKECKSYAYVIYAKRMEVVATIELPNRVPYGFHATFVTEEELQAQKLIA